MSKITWTECFVIGIIVGASTPKSLGGIDNWRFWAYIMLMNILLQSVYGVIKAWRQKAKDRKFKKSLD